MELLLNLPNEFVKTFLYVPQAKQSHTWHLMKISEKAQCIQK